MLRQLAAVLLALSLGPAQAIPVPGDVPLTASVRQPSPVYSAQALSAAAIPFSPLLEISSVYLSVLLISYLTGDSSTLPLLGMAHRSTKGRRQFRWQLHESSPEGELPNPSDHSEMEGSLRERMKHLLEHVSADEVAQRTIANGSALAPKAIEDFAQGKREFPDTLLKRLEIAYHALESRAPMYTPTPAPAPSPAIIQTEAPKPPTAIPSVQDPEPITRNPLMWINSPRSEFHGQQAFVLEMLSTGHINVQIAISGHRRLFKPDELQEDDPAREPADKLPSSETLSSAPSTAAPLPGENPTFTHGTPLDAPPTDRAIQEEAIRRAFTELRQAFEGREFFSVQLIWQQSAVAAQDVQQILDAWVDSGKADSINREDSMLYRLTTSDFEAPLSIHPAILASVGVLVLLAMTWAASSLFPSRSIILFTWLSGVVTAGLAYIAGHTPPAKGTIRQSQSTSLQTSPVLVLPCEGAKRHLAFLREKASGYKGRTFENSSSRRMRVRGIIQGTEKAYAWLDASLLKPDDIFWMDPETGFVFIRTDREFPGLTSDDLALFIIKRWHESMTNIQVIEGLPGMGTDRLPWLDGWVSRRTGCLLFWTGPSERNFRHRRIGEDEVEFVRDLINQALWRKIYRWMTQYGREMTLATLGIPETVFNRHSYSWARFAEKHRNKILAGLERLAKGEFTVPEIPALPPVEIPKAPPRVIRHPQANLATQASGSHSSNRFLLVKLTPHEGLSLLSMISVISAKKAAEITKIRISVLMKLAHGTPLRMTTSTASRLRKIISDWTSSQTPPGVTLSAA